jgi:hypothetical protein
LALLKAKTTKRSKVDLDLLKEMDELDWRCWGYYFCWSATHANVRTHIFTYRWIPLQQNWTEWLLNFLCSLSDSHDGASLVKIICAQSALPTMICPSDKISFI